MEDPAAEEAPAFPVFLSPPEVGIVGVGLIEVQGELWVLGTYRRVLGTYAECSGRRLGFHDLDHSV